MAVVVAVIDPIVIIIMIIIIYYLFIYLLFFLSIQFMQQIDWKPFASLSESRKDQ